MSRKLPPLNALRAFEAAGRHESFTRAAEELGVSHSAISRHVRGLEHRLGAQLFRDLPRGVQLTADGKAYLARIMPALDVISEATEELEAAPAGQITVSSETLFAQRFLIPRLPEFYKACPEIEVRLDASQSLADIERYEADIAVRFLISGGVDAPSDLLTDALLYPYAAPTLIPRGEIAPEDLLQFRLLKDRGRNVWQQWFEAAGLGGEAITEPRWRMRSTLAIEAVIHGHGVYLGSAECVDMECRMGRLIRCSDVGIRSGAYHLVYGSRGVRRRALRQFRNWLLEETKPFRGSGAPG
ncbi:LysR family transcriptional regulator [Roseobacter sp. YSTF-M11]|uniref:LysR family transcriptional regulator n=1 Tax=Roseobacter insulae TaxID=2859783 RepID=A0A9X1K371_9RHOB|nr:LysR substrate-binding domain-containing protein [Roseobacter insulae]MBW4709273.1 LysR family transcriptional regulator [Roseobacter insulae]